MPSEVAHTKRTKALESVPSIPYYYTQNGLLRDTVPLEGKCVYGKNFSTKGNLASKPTA